MNDSDDEEEFMPRRIDVKPMSFNREQQVEQKIRQMPVRFEED